MDRSTDSSISGPSSSSAGRPLTSPAQSRPESRQRQDDDGHVETARSRRSFGEPSSSSPLTFEAGDESFPSTASGGGEERRIRSRWPRVPSTSRTLHHPHHRHPLDFSLSPSSSSSSSATSHIPPDIHALMAGHRSTRTSTSTNRRMRRIDAGLISRRRDWVRERDDDVGGFMDLDRE